MQFKEKEKKTWNNGTIYEGDFKNGIEEGKGEKNGVMEIVIKAPLKTETKKEKVYINL